MAIIVRCPERLCCFFRNFDGLLRERLLAAGNYFFAQFHVVCGENRYSARSRKAELNGWTIIDVIVGFSPYWA